MLIISIGLLLGGIVFLAGLGRVLLPYLVLRSFVVAVGTMITIKGAQLAIRYYVLGRTRNIKDEDVDLEDIAEAEEDDAEEVEPVDMEKPEEDLEEQAEAEEIADVVSRTMAEDEESDEE